MDKLQTKAFDPHECLDDIIGRLNALANTCDGQKMTGYHWKEFCGMAHELKIVKGYVISERGDGAQ